MGPIYSTKSTQPSLLCPHGHYPPPPFRCGRHISIAPKVGAFHEIERYKRVATYALVFSILSFAVAVLMVAWRFTPDEPTFEEMRERVIRTPTEEPRLCVTVFPESINRTFDPEEVGEPLFLTPYIKAGRLEAAARASRVEHVMQTEESYSGFLTVNEELNSNLFFWYFPSRAVEKKKAEEIPLVLWLQGSEWTS